MLDFTIRRTKFIWIKLDLPIITMGVAKMKDVFNKRNSARKSAIITKKYSLKRCFALNIFRMFSSQHAFLLNPQASISVTSSLLLVALVSPFLILIKALIC